MRVDDAVARYPRSCYEIAVWEGRMRWLWGLACACAGPLLTLASPAFAETRIALVIGNGAYQATGALSNPVSDATEIARTLRKADFSTVTLKLDASQTEMRAALQAFARAAQTADVAAVYYAGHGIELGGINYLIPVDARLATDTDLAFEALPLDLVVQSVGGARRLGLVILDACRNNPFAATMKLSGSGQRSVGRGLARVEPVGNTLVAYAARDGTTASDGDANHSPFAEALIRRLPTPGVELSLLFRQVRDDVLVATNNRQQPFTYGSLGGEPFYFVPSATSVPAAAGAQADAGPPPRAPSSSADVELAFWDTIKASTDPTDFADYLKRYPNGVFADLATRRSRPATPVKIAAAEDPGRNANTAAAWSQFWGSWHKTSGVCTASLFIESASPPAYATFDGTRFGLRSGSDNRLMFTSLFSTYTLTENAGVITMGFGSRVCEYRK